jgi:L-ascorbate metabolism protein UlaG (beta-lactamase superfamily)
MKHKLSRRRFIGLGCTGTAGVFWISKSQAFAARFIRERVAEVGREVKASRFKPSPDKWNDNTLTAAWIGHSTVLLNFYGVTILTDPVMFSRVGAELGVGTLGPKRVIGPALVINELPAIDLILLSHAHLDHMDLPTLKKFDGQQRVITSRNTTDLLSETKLSAPIELGWGEKTTVQVGSKDLVVEAFEVAHWGGRWSKKETHRGWNGYILSREGKQIIFGGDTANCASFRDVRAKGPYELALMPIGAYNPWLHAHCTPEEAVEMSNAAGAKYIMPIHHQAFALGREPFNEPIERFEAVLEKERERIALRDVGDTFELKS